MTLYYNETDAQELRQSILDMTMEGESENDDVSGLPDWCSPMDKEIKKLLTDFQFNFAMPMEEDIEIYKDDEMDDEKIAQLRQAICKKFLASILHKTHEIKT